MLQAIVTACSLVPNSYIFQCLACRYHTILSKVSIFQTTLSRLPNMTSASCYLPSITSFPVFPYPHHFSTTSYVIPEMYSLQRDKDIQVLSAYMSQCYHPTFRGIQFQSTYNEKPTQSYIGLIGKAILSSPQQKLVLSDIYNYILTHYPYFRNKGPGERPTLTKQSFSDKLWRMELRHPGPLYLK